MPAVFFSDRVVTVARSPYRSDVALFVGFVRVRTGTAIVGDTSLYRWLVREGWATGDVTRDRAAKLDELTNIPVPIDNLDAFERLFAWDERPLAAPRAGEVCDTYLGAAVRTFFAQGGRLCYVVRVGDPADLQLTTIAESQRVTEMAKAIDALVPADPSAVDRSSWRGVWTLFGVPDVSLVVLPDLPDVVRVIIPPDVEPTPTPLAVEFVVCAEPPASNEPGERLRETRVPTTDDAGYAAWAKALGRVVVEIARPRPEGGLRHVLLVAAVPRAEDDAIGENLLGYLEKFIGTPEDSSTKLLESAFLQLVYPWAFSKTADRLPGNCMPGDAIVAGVIAANALERGTFRSLGGRRIHDVVGVDPLVPMREVTDSSNTTSLVGRLTMFGRSPTGFEMLSDVTGSNDWLWRLGHASRGMGALVRALGVIGQHVAFEASNERVWADIRSRAIAVLREFWNAGALDGDRPSDGFEVVCDRSTMSQADIDNGRLIASITVRIAASIQRIDVTITRTGSSVSLERAA